MSQPLKSPCFVAGTPRASGDVNTGEVNITRGGGRTSCVWSGSLLTTAALAGAPGAVQSGGHILLYAGAGRLNTVIPHALLTSGQPVTFYDAGTITASGTSVSGQRFLGFIPSPMRSPLTALSGNISVAVNWQDQIYLDMPFSSGLCAAAASGAPGFTVSWTPEISVAFPSA